LNLEQVVALEMQQCEYRAIIPSALACGSSSPRFSSVIGHIFDALMWMLMALLYLAAILFVLVGATFGVSKLNGRVVDFGSVLPKVIS
jgi:hypothetical protein